MIKPLKGPYTAVDVENEGEVPNLAFGWSPSKGMTMTIGKEVYGLSVSDAGDVYINLGIWLDAARIDGFR